MDAEKAIADGSAFARVHIELVRIRNFRGLASCDIELEPTLTLLVGRNNAGKSRVLRAVELALGGSGADADDLTVGNNKPATIDIVAAPAPPKTEEDEEVFPEPVGRRLQAVAVTREEPLRERFAWRTTVRRSDEGFGARAESHLLVFDSTKQDWVLPANPSVLTRDQSSLFAVALIGTRRDLVDELTRRGSAIRRVLSDLEVTAETRANLESELAQLGARIVDSSASLAAVRGALEDLEARVGNIGKPALHPLPIRLEELTRSVAIDLDTGGGALPVRLHGSGSRSLASLQVQGVLYDRRLGRDGPALRPHPVTLIEEPEAHLHPQATFEMGHLLATLEGQVVVSTHSSHLVTTIDPRAIRLIRQLEETSTVIDLGPARSDEEATHRALRPRTHVVEMERLKRLVERPFGEVLFASAIVLGDGATERSFLPIVIRHALGGRAHGVCVIDPGSMNSPLAVAAVKFANLISAPWFLFSDTDESGRTAARQLIDDHANGNEERVVWVTAGTSASPHEGAIERMLIEFDEQMCRDACIDVRSDADQSLPTLQLLQRVKGSVGPALARRLIATHDKYASWPDPLRILVERLDVELSG